MTSSGKKDSKAVAVEESARLRELWGSAETGRLPQGEFGEKYGIGGQSAVGNFLHGRSLLSMKAALGFARGLSVSLASFSPRLALEATKISASLTAFDEDDVVMGSATVHPLSQTFQIPLLSELRGSEDGCVEQTLYQGLGKPTIALMTYDVDAYAAKIRGDAFHPRYRSGEFLILSKSAQRTPGADMLVQVEGGSLVLMQFNWARDDEIQLLPLKGDGSPLTLAAADIAWSEGVLAVVKPDLVKKDLDRTN